MIAPGVTDTPPPINRVLPPRSFFSSCRARAAADLRRVLLVPQAIRPSGRQPAPMPARRRRTGGAPAPRPARPGPRRSLAAGPGAGLAGHARSRPSNSRAAVAIRRRAGVFRIQGGDAPGLKSFRTPRTVAGGRAIAQVRGDAGRGPGRPRTPGPSPAGCGKREAGNSVRRKDFRSSREASSRVYEIIHDYTHNHQLRQTPARCLVKHV